MMKQVLPLIGLLVLAGCSSLVPTRPPVTLYALHASAPELGQQSVVKSSGVLRIEDLVLPAGLDNDRIALFLADGQQLDYYAGAKWAAPLDQVLQDVIIEEARNSLPGMTIDTSSLKMAADYKLSIRIRDFAPFYKGGTQAVPLLKVAATFMLIRLPENKVLSDFTIESGKAATSNSMTSVTTGLQALLQSMIKKALDQINNDLIDSQ